MTVTSSTNRIGYAGAGSAGPFTVPFRFIKASHLAVFRVAGSPLPSQVRLVLGQDYTVAGEGADAGSLTLSTPLLTGQQLIILRDVPVTQEADFVEADKLPAQSLEDGLDKLTMIAQQHDEELGRTITANESATPEQVETLRDNVTLLAANAERLIAVNSAVDILERVFTGDGSTTSWTLPAAPASEANVDVWINGVIQKTANYEVAGDKLTITPAVANGVEILTKTRIEVSLAYPTFGSDFLDPGPFGLVGDGVADDTAALQAYFNACIAANKRAVLPSGKFSAVGIVVNNPLHITGQGGYETYDLNTGTWLIHRSTSAPLIRFTGVGARGSSLRGVNVYQNHPAVSAPNTPGSWAPTTYPYVFDVVDCYGGVHFRQIFMWGVYRGISLVNSGRSTVHVLTGQFYQNVIFQDNQLDADAISEIHNWPHTNGSKAVYSWVHTNHVSFLLGRVDSAVYSGKIFSYSGRYLFQLAATANGKATRIKVHSAQADAIPCGIFVSAGANDVSAEFGILDIQGQDLSVWPETLASVPGVWPITIDADGARINIQSLRTEFHNYGLIYTPPSRKNNRLGITHMRGTSYNMSGNAAGAFSLGTTLPANNGGYPVNQVFVGNNLFLEGNNGAPQLDPATTGVVNVAGSGGGSGGDVTDTIRSQDNLTALSVQNAVGARLDNNGTSIWTGDGNISGSMWALTGTSNLKQYIDKKTAGGGVGGGSKLTSPDATQEAEIKDTGGFFVTDTVQSKASRLVADGNIDAGAGGQWSITVGGSTTTDLKNYLTARFNEVISGGASASLLRSPNTTQTAEIKDTGGFFVTDTVQSKASRLVADGNIDAGPSGLWSLTGTTDLKNYLDKRISAGGGSKLLSPSGNQEAEIKDSGGFFVTDTVQSKASRLVADGNIEAGPTGLWSLSGTTDLKNYLDKKFAEGGSGGASSVIRSPDNLSALTMVNATGARLDNNGTSIWTGDGNQTGSGFSTYGGSNLFAVLGAYDTRLDALEAGGGGGGSTSQLVNGSATATLGASNGLTISSGGNAARYQSDGNIVNAAAFTNASNGGLGGTGSLSSYIDARASAFSSAAQTTANTALSTANSAQSTANSAQSTASSAASNASSALSKLGSWQVSGSNWTYGSTSLQTDGNILGSIFSFLGGSTNLYNALQNLNGRIASDETIKLDVKPMGAGLDVVSALTPVSFHFDLEQAPWAQPGPQIGLIAQEVAALAPQAVTQTNGRMGINPLAMVAILVNAVQELQRRIEILEG